MLYSIVEIRRDEVELPEKNKGKNFGPMNPETLKQLGDEFKVLVAIYKLSMTKQPPTYSKLDEMVGGALGKHNTLRLLHFLADWGFVEDQYGSTGPNTAGRLHYIDSDHVQDAREMYEKYVRPHEKPEDQIDFVPDLLIEK